MSKENRRILATMFGLSAMWVGCSSQGTRSNQNAGGSDNSGGDTASNGGADNGGSGGNPVNGGVAGTAAVATGGQGGRATGGSTGGTSTRSGGRGAGGASGGSGGTVNTGGTGGTVTGRVPMFVAVGNGQHTTLSCDDGRTWVEDKFVKATDDDFSHDETNVLGSAYLNGSFYFVMGWANPTKVFSSPDGVNWTNRYTGSGSEGSNLSVGQGALVFGEGNKMHRSTNGGESWPSVTIPISLPHMLQVFGDFGGGRFYAGHETDGVYSDDVGVTWKKTSQPCGGIPVAGGTRFLSYEQWGKTICRSIDGGATWQNLGTCCGTEYIHTVFWDGTRFLLFNSKIWSSVDGVSWTREAATGVEAFASVARSSVTGTYVATQQGWLPGVAFFRSTDGIHWTKLPATAYSARGANLEYIRFGFGSPSANCAEP